jgi:dTDP-4-amino-4,6-dideoxygalactose transaminase
MEIAYSEALRQVEGNPSPRRTINPPNRLETRNRELLAALRHAGNPNALESLREALRNITGRQHVYFAPSCRCAIAQILTMLPQKEVVIPAFTCPVVKTAVQVAGKRIIYVDIDKHGLNATSAQYAEHARPGRVLLPTHLFGFPTDIEKICEVARANDCVTIEDAAAAFHARRNGRVLGTFADFGIFSFERSKRLPAFRGAAIIVNNDRLVIPERLGSHRTVATKLAMPLRELVVHLVYNLATNPWFYGRFTLPRILRRYAGMSIDSISDSQKDGTDTPFYTRDFHPYQAELVLRSLQRLDGIRAAVARLVSIYRDVFKDTPIHTFGTTGTDEAALLRYPIAVPGADRAGILRMALKRGIYLETNYERPLVEESEYSRFPNSSWAANNLLLLPLYKALPFRAAEHIARQVLEIGEAMSSHHGADTRRHGSQGSSL